MKKLIGEEILINDKSIIFINNYMKLKFFIKCEECSYKKYISLTELEQWVNKQCPKCEHLPILTKQDVLLLKEKLIPLTDKTVNLGTMLKEKGINFNNDCNNVEFSYNRGKFNIKGF